MTFSTEAQASEQDQPQSQEITLRIHLAYQEISHNALTQIPRIQVANQLTTTARELSLAIAPLLPEKDQTFEAYCRLRTPESHQSYETAIDKIYQQARNLGLRTPDELKPQIPEPSATPVITFWNLVQIGRRYQDPYTYIPHPMKASLSIVYHSLWMTEFPIAELQHGQTELQVISDKPLRLPSMSLQNINTPHFLPLASSIS